MSHPGTVGLAAGVKPRQIAGNKASRTPLEAMARRERKVSFGPNHTGGSRDKRGMKEGRPFSACFQD